MRATPTADRTPLWNIRKEKRLATGALNELYIYIYTYIRIHAKRFSDPFLPATWIDHPPRYIRRVHTYIRAYNGSSCRNPECLKAGALSRIIHNNGVYNTLPRAAAIKRLVTRADRRATVTS